MKPKSILTLTLLGLVVACTGFLLVRGFVGLDVWGRGDSASAQADAPPPADGLIVYYFNGNFHCPTCDNFEAYTRKTLQSDFAEPMKQGRLQWRVVNVDVPANRHFIREYRVISRMIVLATFRDGRQVRSRSLDRIWDLVADEGDFTRYIREEVATEMRGVAPSVAQPGAMLPSAEACRATSECSNHASEDGSMAPSAFLLAAITAWWMGICASIAPCPLASNILAVSFLARQGGGRGKILTRSLAYAMGGMLAYAALGALAVWGVLNVPIASQFLQKYITKVLGIVLILVGMVLTGLLKPRFRVAWRRCLPEGLSPFFGAVSEKWGLSLNLGRLGTVPILKRPKMGTVPYAYGAGLLGAAVLGMLLFLSFCPTTAWLFFGGLLSTAIEEHSPLLLPSLYGLGAALPVMILGSLLAGGTQLAGKVSGSLQTVEKYTRLATGTLFVAVGIWFCLRNILGLF
jgi:cytochrome c biogenesis protein CcdA